MGRRRTGARAWSVLTGLLRVRPCEFRLVGLLIRRKTFSGFCPSCLYRQAEAGSSDSWVNTTLSKRGRKVYVLLLDSASGGHRIPTRACLRVTTGTSEVDTVW